MEKTSEQNVSQQIQWRKNMKRTGETKLKLYLNKEYYTESSSWRNAEETLFCYVSQYECKTSSLAICLKSVFRLLMWQILRSMIYLALFRHKWPT